jgi:hypothetical protein
MTDREFETDEECPAFVPPPGRERNASDVTECYACSRPRMEHARGGEPR